MDGGGAYWMLEMMRCEEIVKHTSTPQAEVSLVVGLERMVAASGTMLLTSAAPTVLVGVPVVGLVSALIAMTICERDSRLWNGFKREERAELVQDRL